MTQTLAKGIMIPMLILGLTACGYQEGDNGSKASIHEIGDNRQEYLIKNRTAENEYLDMNTNPHIDTRITDEKIGTESNATLQLAESDMEETIQRRVLQINGVKTAEVQVKDRKITIRFQPKTGTNVQALNQQIADLVTKLYGLETNVTPY